MSTIDKNRVKPGEILHEVSYYTVQSVDKDSNKAILQRIENGKNIEVEVNLDSIQENMSSCDQYSKVIKVNKKDTSKPGIRSIFSQIPAGAVFTVTFQKDDTKKSKKTIKEEKEAKFKEISDKIIETYKSKKGVTKKAINEIGKLINNPVLSVIPGEIRTLRGYKEDSKISEDGLYLVRDLEIDDPTKNFRNVNIRGIRELIYNGIKYEVIDK